VKGVILAGGTGSRLGSLTKATNKHLLPVGDKPMIFHPIEKLVKANIKDILVVTGTEHIGNMVQCLGSGKAFGCNFTYRVQDESGGIAQALGLARGFCYGERMCVLLGDNIFSQDLTPIIQAYHGCERGAMVTLTAVPDLERYGVAIVEASGKLFSGITEKPSSDEVAKLKAMGALLYAVAGIYLYDQQVFSIIDSLKPSARNEFEITDVNNQYFSWGELNSYVMDGWWTDSGTLPSLMLANKLVTEV
jgi:glucose-1-phosphate thymidylyltransferase